MAAIYTQQGETITEGLQGCNACDEAYQAACRQADERGEAVHLVDDDGEFLVHPEIAGERPIATRLATAVVEAEEDY